MKNILVMISLRNLLRQKRRNILLGVAIAFGTLILILANAFSSGLTDVILNRIVKYTNGHVALGYSQNGNLMNQIFRDGDRIKHIIEKEAPNAEMKSEAIGMMARAIGNTRADNVIMVGIDLGATISKKDAEEYLANFKMIDGSFENLKDSTLENPVAIATQKATYLGLKRGDVLKVKFTNVDGQSQSARLTVAAIFKPANVFMSSPIFLNMPDVKKITGYGPHDVANYQINIANPKKASIDLANRIHASLKSGMGAIYGTARSAQSTASLIVLGMRNDTASHKIFATHITLSAGDTSTALSRTGAIISQESAQALGIAIGDTIRVSYAGKYAPDSGSFRVTINGIAAFGNKLPTQTLLLNEKEFYKNFYEPWAATDTTQAKLLPDSASPVFAGIAPEYLLIKRCKTTDEYTKALKEAGKARYKGITVSVQSMYETASIVLQMESVLTLVTLVAVLILFCIILIGVINTLRMTIRERTREIGTVRAIGMQASDVRTSFLLETFFLAFFSSVIGGFGAYGAMALLSLWHLGGEDNQLSMLLVSGHLHFTPSLLASVGYVLMIQIIAVVTAFFPARAAAKMSAAEALRHYE